MTHLKKIFLLLTPLAVFFSYFVAAQTDDINHFYVGSRIGTANSMTISDRGDTAEIGNSGFSGTYLIGYKFDKNWSIETGSTHSEDLDFYFFAGNNVNVSGKYLAGNYTHFFNDGGFFLRARAGLIAWKAHAEERSTLFGLNLVSGDPDGPFSNSGVSPILGAEIGYEFNKWIEWTIIGLDSVPNGDAQWTVAHTGFRISF